MNDLGVFMSKQKKQIILNEIAFWKQSKMLPEKYCDYLMMMYTEGDKDHAELRGQAKESIKAKEKKQFSKVIYSILSIVALLAMMLFIIPSVLTVSIIVALAIIGFVVASFVMQRSSQVIAIVLQIGAALLLLVLTVRVTTTYYDGNNLALFIGLGINCLFWLLSGLKMKLPYFTFSGILGLVVLVAYWFMKM